MSYTINKTDGSILEVVADGTVNDEYSLRIVGRNYANYGEILGENNIRLLESGSNDTPPPNPLMGQLWFDKVSELLKVYDGIDFKNIGGAKSSDIEPVSPEIGDMWFNNDTDELFVYGSTGWVLIGPDIASTENGAVVEVIEDENGSFHTIIKFMSEGEVVAIVSKDPEFVPLVPIPGFPSITPGIQLVYLISGQTPTFDGTAQSSLEVDDGSGNSVDIPALVADVDNKVNRDGDTMTGPLTLPSDPVDPYDAACKNYVDTQISSGGTGHDISKVNVAGDTMTGDLLLPGDPTLDLHATTKKFVEDKLIDGGDF